MRPGLLAGALLLAACAKPYGDPEVVPDRAFRGVAQTIAAQPATAPRGVRIVAVHGMCSDNHRASGKQNWVKRRAETIGDALGQEVVVGDPVPEPISYDSDGIGPALHRYDVRIADGEAPVDASFLVWGRHVDRHREALRYDSFRRDELNPGEPVRADLNHGLRSELMNQCLIDAVAYLGTSGNQIRADMQQALCDLFGGMIEGTPTGVPGQPAACRIDGPVDPRPVVLIPESLGSAILVDAVLALADGGRDGGMAEALGRIDSIFLMSNQFPLLAQGNAPLRRGAKAIATDEPRALNDFLELLLASRARTLRARERNIQLVAFSDPNDVFSYRLDPKFLSPAVRDRVELWNVLVSNDRTWLGLIENPVQAHQGYERQQVFDLLARGYSPG